jgi:hypothetical protein
MEKRGRPFEAGNKFGRGRPRGSRNKSTIAMEDLLSEYSEPLARKAIVMGLQGDKTMLKMLLDPTLKACRALKANIGTIKVETLADLSSASMMIINKTTKGEISLDVAGGLSALLDGRRHVIETEDLEKRLRDLESKS